MKSILILAVMMISSLSFADQYERECKKECRLTGKECRSQSEVNWLCTSYDRKEAIRLAREEYNVRASSCREAVRGICRVMEKECKDDCEY